MKNIEKVLRDNQENEILRLQNTAVEAIMKLRDAKKLNIIINLLLSALR